MQFFCNDLPIFGIIVYTWLNYDCNFYNLIYQIVSSTPRLSIKQKFINIISPYPKLGALVVGLAITVAVGAAIGMLDSHSASAVNIIVPGHHRR